MVGHSLDKLSTSFLINPGEPSPLGASTSGPGAGAGAGAETIGSHRFLKAPAPQNSHSYQLLPSLSDEEYQALKIDIAKHGILVPIEFDEEGNILDGYHRMRAYNELKKEGYKLAPYPSIARKGMTEAEKENHAIALNLIRRHLTTEQKKPYWSRLRQQGMSYQAIAKVSGVSKPTVINSVGKNLLTQPDFIVGKDGKHYPPTKKRTVSIFANDDAQRVRALSVQLEAESGKVLDIRRAERISREQENEKRRIQNENPPPVSIGEISLFCGDFIDTLNFIENNTVGLICTDPPYGKEYLSEWQKLFIFAERVLKPSGWLVTYCGQANLDKVIKSNGNLEYVWTIAQLNTASDKNINHQRKFYSQWKPLLIFVKPPFQAIDWINDVIYGAGKEKELHDWQQGLTEAKYMIEHFSKKDDLVVDPFLGSGTTAVAAKALGRRFIGCDIDPANFSKAQERLNGTN